MFRHPFFFSRFPAIAALVLASCTAGPEVLPATSSSPQVSLPQKSMRVVKVTPGRFAGTLDIESTTSCSQSWGATRSRGTVVLQLHADGSATGCRGRHYRNVVQGFTDEELHIAPSFEVQRLVDRPRPDTTIRIEQQGMRGRWSHDGDGIVVDLALDSTICASRAEGMRDPPKPWRLRCMSIQPNDATPRLGAAVLACHWIDAAGKRLSDWEMQGGYATPSVLYDGNWIFLGNNNGLRLKEQSIGPGLYNDPELKWEEASVAIPYDDWDRLSAKK